MKHKILTDILEQCAKIDRHAVDSYLMFSRNTAEPEEREFWETMSSEESDHVQMWESLLKLAEMNVLPRVFEQPADILAGLNRLLTENENYLEWYTQEPSSLRAFITAYHIEFNMMDPAFLSLMQFYGTVLGDDALDVDFGGHITRIGEAVEQFAPDSPVMKLLRNSIERVYADNDRLVWQTRRDNLTGLLNRRGFFDVVVSLGHLARRNKYPVGLLLIDIDDFKAYNDTHGIPAGDQVLQAVAHAVAADLRQSDLFSRFGGDSFIAFLPEVDPSALGNLAESLRRRIEIEPDLQPPITISIGFTQGRIRKEVQGEIQSMIKTAEDRLERAKREGKNRIVG